MKNFDLSANSQRARLLERLRQGPVSTLEARHKLAILGVGPRIFELRHELGFNIQTQFSIRENPGSATLHRVAEYVLLPGKYKGLTS